MSHKRVKTFAVDEDYYDDYEEPDYGYEDDENPDSGLTDDDKEQMSLGTAKVRSLLPASFPITDAQIQDALWNYYYDVDKSVSYLKSKHRPATSAAPKNEVTTSEQSISAQSFFSDCPWLNISEHRKALILVEPLYPKGRLLGGSAAPPKMSKVAALAAKRRQKENERTFPSMPSKESSEGDVSSRLKRMRLSKDIASEGISQSHDQRAKNTPYHFDAMDMDPKLPRESENAATIASGHKLLPPSLPPKEQSVVARRAQPSSFAELLTRTPCTNTGLFLSDILKALPNTSSFEPFDFSTPSPDDIVANAQGVKVQSASKASSKQKGPLKPKTDITNGVSSLSIHEPVSTKSKNLDVVSEYKKVERKRAANFVVIGHVDSGKSTLMGRLLFDLKAIDQHTMNKYREEAARIGKGSFAFAWVLDQGTEERARGVTIDIATRNFSTDKTDFTILDAPGHRDFVPNMIAGASQADFAVLVVDASTGNFESGLKGQTKEHALLVRSIGIQRIIVAINKMDAVAWSQDRFEEIQQQMSGFLTSSGFQAKNLAYVPCSGLKGENILRKPEEAKAAWYSGPTVVEELDDSETATFALDKPLRMTIDDVFRGSVLHPLSISGRLDAGTTQVGEQIQVMPSGERATIKSLEIGNEPSDWAAAGQNVVMNLTNIEPIHLKVGDVVCSPKAPIPNVMQFTAKVLAFDHLMPMFVEVHKGRQHVPGRVSQLIASLDKSNGNVVKKKPKVVQPGTVVRVVVELESKTPLEAPARVVLRADGETVAAGLIE